MSCRTPLPTTFSFLAHTEVAQARFVALLERLCADLPGSGGLSHVWVRTYALTQQQNTLLKRQVELLEARVKELEAG